MEYQKHIKDLNLPPVSGRSLDPVGQGLLDKILRDPASTITLKNEGALTNFPDALEILGPDGIKAVFNAEGEFAYFGRWK